MTTATFPDRSIALVLVPGEDADRVGVAAEAGPLALVNL
ncbi:hypothetical protein MGAST_21080 [Mycobacterium gastri 'Wayne']|nr:hypothetical protein MGAST_21080 [Mycobacterium gastri 'Wayne']